MKEGPTALVFTTTKAKVHPENETRVLSMTSDDSRAQTRRVLTVLASAGEAPDLSEWLQLQSWLQDQDPEQRRTIIPYAEVLAREIPPVATRLRRDFAAILSLIRAHAILHQQTRERDALGRIVANWDDYEVVRELVAPLVAEAVGRTVSAATRDTVAAVAQLADSHPSGVTAQVVAKHLNLHRSTVVRRLWVAGEDGWLVNQEDRRGRPGAGSSASRSPRRDRCCPTWSGCATPCNPQRPV